MNNFIIVGRIIDDFILEETENGKNTCTIILSVQRVFKNDEGIYDYDIVPISLVGNIAKQTYEYCKKGDVVGVRGRIARLYHSDLQLIGDKITFLNVVNNVDKVKESE